MGLNYSYVTVIKGWEKQNLLRYVTNFGKIQKLDFGECAIIDFDLDIHLLKHLKTEIRRQEGWSLGSVFLNKKKFPDYFPNSNTGRIGCIYIKFEAIKNTDLLFVQFTAATTSISVLFQQSQSIRNWFIKLSKEICSEVSFIDLEENGFEVFYISGNNSKYFFKSDEIPESFTCAERLKDYINLFYPYLHDNSRCFK